MEFRYFMSDVRYNSYIINIFLFLTVNDILTDSVSVKLTQLKKKITKIKVTKIYVNSNLLIEDNKIEKWSILTEYAPERNRINSINFNKIRDRQS